MSRTKRLLPVVAVGAALAICGLFGPAARATGTPENASVTYYSSGSYIGGGVETSPNGTIDVGDSTLDAGSSNFNFQFGAPLTVTATDTTSLAQYSLTGMVGSPFDIEIDPSTLPAGTYSLSFDNNSGGVPDGSSDIDWTLTPDLTVASPISTPTLTGLTPSQATAGNSGVTLTATGTGFISGATVDWNGAPLTTTFGSATSVSATVPGSDLSATGTAAVTVVNPDTGTTSSLSFAIVAAPTVTAISPNSATAGSASLPLTVTGTNFVSGDQITWNGSPLGTTYVSATELTTTIPPPDLATAGTAGVAVETSDGVSSNSQPLTISAAPSVANLSPSSAPVRSTSVALTVNGAGFAAGDSITWNGAALTTTFVGATKLTATLPNTDLAGAGVANVAVRALDSISSNAKPFTIVSAPTLASIAPSTASAGSGSTVVTATGTGFTSGAVVRWNSVALSTSFVSATQLTATVPGTDLSTAGTFAVSVLNPDGGATGNVSFSVTRNAPAIGTISPGSVGAGAAATQFTVTGSNFDSVATVSFEGGSAITPDSVESATKLLVTLPAVDLARAGRYSLTVSTEAGPSSASDLTVAPVSSFGAAGLKMVSSPYDTSGLSIAPDAIGWIDPPTGQETDIAPLSIVDWTGSAYAAPSTGLKLGVGYWMRVPSLSDSGGTPEALSLLVKGSPATSDSQFKIALSEGWNLIGDPLPSGVPLTELTIEATSPNGLQSISYLKAVQDDVVSSDIYTYDSSVSTNYKDLSIDQSGAAIEPYAGYWVLAMTPCTLEFPAAP